MDVSKDTLCSLHYQNRCLNSNASAIMMIYVSNLSYPTDQNRPFATGHYYWICDCFHSLKKYTEHLLRTISPYLFAFERYQYFYLHIGVLLPGCVDPDPLTPDPAIPLKLVGVTLPGFVPPPAVLLTLELGVRR